MSGLRWDDVNVDILADIRAAKEEAFRNCGYRISGPSPEVYGEAHARVMGRIVMRVTSPTNYLGELLRLLANHAMTGRFER